MSKSSTSDSDSSQDENMAKLREAADTTLICDAMFTTNTRKPQLIAGNSEGTTKQPESQRYSHENEYHQTDLNIPKSMQDFIYKKLSKKIASKIEFVDVDCKRKPNKSMVENDSAVKLLNDTKPITHIDEMVVMDEPIVVKRSKPSIVKRQIEPDRMTDEEKLRAVVVNAQSVLEGNEVRCWKARKVRTHKMFNYREKNKQLYLVEPTNEFSTKRKKNNWTESKIAK